MRPRVIKREPGGQAVSATTYYPKQQQQQQQQARETVARADQVQIHEPCVSSLSI